MGGYLLLSQTPNEGNERERVRAGSKKIKCILTATSIITPRACARGNVISFVCRLSSVCLSVISTKIARSGDLDI